MFKQLIIVWLVVAAAIAITAALLPSVEIDGGFVALLGVALVFGLVNALIGTAAATDLAAPHADDVRSVRPGHQRASCWPSPPA